MEFLIRLSFIVIIIALYWLGGFLTEKFCIPIEFKSILPIISLVYWDYYFSYLSRWLFRIQVKDVKLLDTDGKIHTIKLEFKLSNKGNKDVWFKIKEVMVEGYTIDSTIGSNNAEEFQFLSEKNSISDTITLACVFKKVLSMPQKKCRRYNKYSFKIIIKYIINNSIIRTEIINSQKNKNS